MKLAVLTALALVALAAPAAALDNGVPDRHRHPNVGLLAYDVDGPGGDPPAYLCSGSVISDRAFLTAAHCIGFIPGAAWSVSLAPGSPASPAMEPGIVFDDFPFSVLGPTTPAERVVVHPGFDPATLAHDLAILVMPRGTFAGVRPVRVPRKELPLRRPVPVGLAAYGADPGVSGVVLEGYRQRAWSRVRAGAGPFLELDNDGRRGGVCIGDSGGPQLLPGTDVAISHVSTSGSGDVPCTGTALLHRLDTPAERRFLARYAG